ncbi:hypothetical protein SAY87_017334 [Trapa incisa]|uniref:RNA methyltransferase n=1 Tax=Trapa incisa TaxID=236973 RepID=A0AAN7L2V3_9MYRT|nr:hypothetical protein SAY87_017334 [Trapa incisa]
MGGAVAAEESEANHKSAAGESKEKHGSAAKEKQNKNKRKRKEVAPFGNYRNYYGYRNGHDLDGDPRLKVMKKEWFEGKACLDIGCNNGLITIHIARKFLCHSILGIDIDSNRIEDAHWNLRKVMKMESVKRNSINSSKLKNEEKSNGSKQIADSSPDQEATIIFEDPTCKSEDLSSVVSFQHENFVQSRHMGSGHYDTILCLSVTKWVHLNWGDEGLINLFSKVWRLLQPGGVFILEPQPWRSYEQNRLVSETTSRNYSQIMFPPHYFQEILLDKIGFRTVEDLTAALSGAKTGFNRPVLAFYK